MLVVAGVILVSLPSVFAADPSLTDPNMVARQTVAEMLGIDPANVRVVSTEPREFADASLGCPEPGSAYAQVITPGFRILLEADGRRFDVRVAGTAGRICYRRKSAGVQPVDEASRPRVLGEAAREDLAGRLGVSPLTITVTDLRRLKPGETVPGCGEVCAGNVPQSSCGVGIRLRAGEQEFDYVGLAAGVRPCPDIAAR